MPNRNGQYLQNLITKNGLYCLNTQFQKKCGKLWAHRYPNCVKATYTYSYFFVNRKLINTLIICKAYSTFEAPTIVFLSAKIRLFLRAHKPKASSSPPYDCSTLLSNYDIRNRCTITVRNIFDHHRQATGHHTPNSTFMITL